MDPVITGLSSYSGQLKNEIIGQIFRSLDAQGVTIETGVKGETKFPKMTIASGLKPYTGTFSATAGVLTLSDRSLSPKMAQFDFQYETKKLRTTAFGPQIAKGANNQTLPFQAQFFKSVTDKIVDHLVTSVIGVGDLTYVGADTARNLCDGFLTRAAALVTGGFTPITLGAITSANAVTQFESFYAQAVAANSALRNKPMRLYTSWGNFDDYITHYRTLFTNDPDNWKDGGRSLYLKNSTGMCEVFPADWIGTSNRIFLTDPKNMVIGTDNLSDMNDIKLLEEMYHMNCGITFTFDTQIIDVDTQQFFINELT